ncbi:MAG TPA: choice-of-anchor B family protein [Bacteroidetes bacterium]|nr:choice-of-anchor B family protein [Bacteroidota bacterium]
MLKQLRLLIGLYLGLLIGSTSIMAQVSQNMSLIGSWDDNTLPLINSNSFNDVWGYAANGREYALLGSVGGVFFIDVTNPVTPQVITFQPGGSTYSIWRDLKTYSHYLYAISDQGLNSSLQIFDLSNLPNGVTKVYDSQTHFTTAHNLFVNDASGRLYVAGANTQANGILILDIGTDPTNPSLLASFTLGAYTHDIFVRNDTCHAYYGNSGFAIFDLVDLTNPSQLNLIYPMQYAESGYAHSGYASEDGKYIFWCDETHDTGIHVAEMSDPGNLVYGSNFRSTLLAPFHTNSIPHNPFVKDNLLYVSYYHDGLQVWDISNPKSPVKAAYYDTDPSNTDYLSTLGCWGVYPYLPSGNILTSDVRNGLAILRLSNLFPISLDKFAVESQPHRVRLRWTTYQETNNENFTVERSLDGLNFSALESIPGAGNHTGALHYETFDQHPLEGLAYYRLKQTDFDGGFTYSEILSIHRGTDFHLLNVYPSPAGPGQEVYIKLDLNAAQNIQVQVSDMLGKIVFKKMWNMSSGPQSLEIPANMWSAGTYFVRLIGKNTRIEQKLILSN